MKVILTIKNEDRIFENVTKFSSYPDKESPRASIYITYMGLHENKPAEITEHLEMYESFDIEIE